MNIDVFKQDRPYDALAFGEVVLRLMAPLRERISQSNSLEKSAGCAELNVVSGLSRLGLKTAFLTKLPVNGIGEYIQNRIRLDGPDDKYVLADRSKDARLGISYTESGAYPRKATVFYDRKNSSVNSLSIDEVPPEIYTSARLFHTSGISLALSQNVRETVMEMVRRFKAAGTLISFDINYRESLWDEKTAKEAILRIFPYVDILFISEETSRRMMAKTGNLKSIIKSYTQEHPISVVASTQRVVNGHNSHDFGSLLYDAATDSFFSEEPYRNIEVVDRVGSGDAYLAGALFGLLKWNDCAKAVEYGDAMAAVKNTVTGDVPICSYDEITQIIRSHKSNEKGSELNR